jgi:hypothetical protein
MPQAFFVVYRPFADQGYAKFAPPIVEIESDHYVACYRTIDEN